ncbi:MAG TPA: ROK family protein [Chitinophagaceae bacterium]
MSIVLGVDIGGSHITAALVDLNFRSVVAGSNKRRLVNSQASVEEIIHDWCDVMSSALNAGPDVLQRIGIAMPGPFNYEEGISLIKDQDKFKALYNMNIKNILAERLAIKAEYIHFMNDAVCFLQGEVFGGAAREFDQVLGITLGTGLGSATYKEEIAVDADLWKSPFKDGIAEDYLSTRWFVNRYQELGGKLFSGVKEMIEKDGSSLLVKKLFDEFSENLTQFLLPQIEKYKSEAVVLGGNISNAFPLFEPALQTNFRASNVDVEIKKAQLSEDALLIGAASCWKKVNRQTIAKQESKISRA